MNFGIYYILIICVSPIVADGLTRIFVLFVFLSVNLSESRKPGVRYEFPARYVRMNAVV